MHATSLHTLVMLVAQAAPGGDFQLPTDKVDVPQLLAPPARTTPTPASGETAPPKAPPAQTTPVQVTPPSAEKSPSFPQEVERRVEGPPSLATVQSRL